MLCRLRVLCYNCYHTGWDNGRNILFVRSEVEERQREPSSSLSLGGLLQAGEMDQIMNKVGSYWLGQKANKEFNSVGDDFNVSFSISFSGLLLLIVSAYHFNRSVIDLEFLILDGYLCFGNEFCLYLLGLIKKLVVCLMKILLVKTA